MVGLEEGIFPHVHSYLGSSDELEEERRLCYVGITRARKQLYLSHAESRRLYGSETYPSPSRFLKEIPAEITHEIRIKGSATVTASNKQWDVEEEAGEFYLGQRVSHAKFGEGIVLNYEGHGPSARIQINFKDVGSKWLVVSYANLQEA